MKEYFDEVLRQALNTKSAYSANNTSSKYSLVDNETIQFLIASLPEQ
jgi:hypothetical protein